MYIIYILYELNSYSYHIRISIIEKYYITEYDKCHTYNDYIIIICYTDCIFRDGRKCSHSVTETHTMARIRCCWLSYHILYIVIYLYIIQVLCTYEWTVSCGSIIIIYLYISWHILQYVFDLDFEIILYQLCRQRRNNIFFEYSV